MLTLNAMKSGALKKQLHPSPFKPDASTKMPNEVSTQKNTVGSHTPQAVLPPDTLAKTAASESHVQSFLRLVEQGDRKRLKNLHQGALDDPRFELSHEEGCRMYLRAWKFPFFGNRPYGDSTEYPLEEDAGPEAGPAQAKKLFEIAARKTKWDYERPGLGHDDTKSILTLMRARQPLIPERLHAAARKPGWVLSVAEVKEIKENLSHYQRYAHSLGKWEDPSTGPDAEVIKALRELLDKKTPKLSLALSAVGGFFKSAWNIATYKPFDPRSTR